MIRPNGPFLAAAALTLGVAAAWAQAPTAPAQDVPAEISAEGMPDASVLDIAPALPDPAALPDQPQAAPVDPASLAAMRADLASLGKALQSLRAELRASGPTGFAIAGGTGAIDRMDRMESEIARLTGEVEGMRNRVEAAIAEGSKRAGDIEFRLCEMDPACDLGALTTSQLDAAVTGAQPTVAGDPPGAASPPAAQPSANGEGSALDRARQTAAAGDYAAAAQMFAAFAADHPTSPLIPEALYLQGEALAAAGDAKGAAGAWLQAFTANPTGHYAAQSLLGLSDTMAKTGKPEDACLFLNDISTRFPGTPAALEAVSRAEAQGCAAVAPTAPADGTAMDPEAAADLADGN